MPFTVIIGLSIQFVKKILTDTTAYFAHKYALSVPCVCSYISYHSNAHVAFCYMGVCCNSPQLGRKGVNEYEIF